MYFQARWSLEKSRRSETWPGFFFPITYKMAPILKKSERGKLSPIHPEIPFLIQNKFHFQLYILIPIEWIIQQEC